MHSTFQEVRSGLVRQILLIGLKKVLQCHTHYLKDVSIFVGYLLGSVGSCNFSNSHSEGLKNKFLCSH